MKIGIVTIYESITNLGSFLQAYALKEFLQDAGHEIIFIENTSIWKSILKNELKLNPKREVLLRQLKTIYFIKDMKLLRRISKKEINNIGLDCLIYGSDEIWNMDNPYFNDPLFLGGIAPNIPKIAYGISMGHVKEQTLQMYPELFNNAKLFTKILVRDKRTYDILNKNGLQDMEMVCDPTLLLPLNRLEKWIDRPKEKYMLVYTYGLEEKWIKYIEKFAKEKCLKIISACFWHPWADRVIECSALQFSQLIAGAEYVFTTTFHGAIFTLLNHKQCCILPIRVKVKELVKQLHEECHLIDESSNFSQIEQTFEIKFDTEKFEKNLTLLRTDSIRILEGVLKCLKE